MPAFGSLPPEIKTLIFKNLQIADAPTRLGIRDAAAISLVSKELADFGRAILYESVVTYGIVAPLDDADLINLILDMRLKAVITYPHLGAFVESLSVDMKRLWSILVPGVPRKVHGAPSLYSTSAEEFHPVVGQLAHFLRQCTNLNDLALENAAPNELLNLLDALGECKHLQDLDFGWESLAINQLDTGGLEYNAHDCESRSNWLLKVLAQVCRHSSLKILDISYSLPDTSKQPKDQQHQLASMIAQRGDRPLLSVPNVNIRCDYNPNLLLHICNFSSLVHLGLKLGHGTMDLLCHDTFPNVTRLSLEDGPVLLFFRPEQSYKLWPQFPALEVFFYHNCVGSEFREIEIDVTQTDLPDFTLFLRSLPANLRTLKFVDQRYFYEANMTEVDRVWKGDRLPHLERVLMYKKYRLMTDEELYKINDNEDITPLLQSQSSLLCFAKLSFTD